MGARAKGARSPIERGVKQELRDAEERTLVGACKMVAPRFLSQSMPAFGEKRVGKPAMDVNPGSQVSKDVVIISDDEEELQEVSTRLVDPISGAGPAEAQPSTSQGAGAGWADLHEDLLDYEDEVEVPVTSKKWVVVTGEVPGVVQGGHVPAPRQEMSAGNLPRGEEGFVGSLRRHERWDNFGDSSRATVSNVMGGSKEIQNKVDASIQVIAVMEAEGKKVVSAGTDDGSLEKVESGEGGKSGALILVVTWRLRRRSGQGVRSVDCRTLLCSLDGQASCIAAFWEAIGA
ncbi:hypothetical protein NDU88_002029 [Pleurodeles waltl]|uniref:Uncharacterized protein n=1 Tax=Pleurodeles waltl TaxID=8319 RepID=A0AAV7UUD8_PLEWA|nr:hypothetical protein NDU88_002029 [Pleurodeles waltl]